MSSGVQRTMYGQFLASGALQSILTVGFKPRIVRLYNQTSGIQLEWQESFPDATGKKTAANGAVTFAAVNGITQLEKGFSLGTDSINTAAQIIHYSATE